MKKCLSIILILIILIVLESSTCIYTSYAAGTVSGGKTATGVLIDVKYISKDGCESADIILQDFMDYSVMEIFNPRRIVLDIYNVSAPGRQQIINCKGKLLKRIRYAQFDPYTARVVLEVNDESEYGVEVTETGLELYVGDRQYRAKQPENTHSGDINNGPPVDGADAGVDYQDNDDIGGSSDKAATVIEYDGGKIEYHNSGDRVYFILRDAVVTEGDEFLKKLYTDKYDPAGYKYTMTFKSGKTNFGNGVMQINDKYLKSVEIRSNSHNGTTTIILQGSGINRYFAYTRGSSGISSITVLRPRSNAEKLVVIDAGHGGVATGAIYKNLQEKELNLDIAKRLNALLKEKGINTYMLREDDSSIGNYERAYIANNLNARLYISIHNNAIDSINFGGTMTLYYPTAGYNSFTGRNFAQIVQKNLLSSLGTVDRKIKSRTDLVVLKATKMPACIAEVAYMTNSSDRSSLQKEAFRQKAAQALCRSVIEVLGKIK